MAGNVKAEFSHSPLQMVREVTPGSPVEDVMDGVSHGWGGVGFVSYMAGR